MSKAIIVLARQAAFILAALVGLSVFAHASTQQVTGEVPGPLLDPAALGDQEEGRLYAQRDRQPNGQIPEAMRDLLEGLVAPGQGDERSANARPGGERPRGEYPRNFRRLSCEHGREYIGVIGGRVDGFSTSDGLEQTYPSPTLVSFLNTVPSYHVDTNRYDHNRMNYQFGDTFEFNIPGGWAAVHMRITGSFRDIGGNSLDRISFEQRLPSGALGFPSFSYVNSPGTSATTEIWNIPMGPIVPNPGGGGTDGAVVLAAVTDNKFIDIRQQDDTSVDYLVVELCIERRGGGGRDEGLTWNWKHSDAVTGVVTVGCRSSSPSYECDPYDGDMVCTTILPLLCFNDMGAPPPASFDNSDAYNQWAGGVVHTSSPVAASSFATRADANAYCVAEFGRGWRVARHADGQHWNFTAYGNVGDPRQEHRFWMDILNQPNAVCWQ